MAGRLLSKHPFQVSGAGDHVHEGGSRLRSGPARARRDGRRRARLGKTAGGCPGHAARRVRRESLAQRFRTFAVVDPEGICLGVVDLDAATALPPETWPTRTVEEVMREPAAAGLPHWTVHEALELMAAAQVDHLPVLEPSGRLVGVVRSSEVLRLSEILDQIRSDAFRRPA